jgi:Ca-activated chloride channel family protein
MKSDFTNPHFAAPAWLWVALLAPLVLLAFQVHACRARRRELALLASPAALEVMLRSHSPAWRVVKNVLRLVLVFLIGITLARPQWGEQTEQSESLGEDVVFVLDCSLSMTATDVKPSRLGRAKLAIQEFVQNYGRGRVGLVAFAGQAFLQCPLTFDYDAFRDALSAVDERTIPVPGTDIGRALQEGFSAVEKNGRRKILVLISDGEDLEKASVTTAKNLAGKNIVIFTVGVGTASGSEVYFSTPAGGRELLRTEQDQPVHSRLDEPTLRAIAEATHGSYQPLGSLGDGLDRVRQALEKPDGSARFVMARRDGVDHFRVPAALVLILLVGESLLSTRRAKRKSDLPRRVSPVAPPVTLGLLLLGFALTLRGAETTAEVPTSSRALFNLGAGNLQNGRWREAENALNAAVNANDPEIQPLALFNLGHVRFHAGQELLKGVAHSGDLEAQGDKAIEAAGPVVKSADAALAGDDLRAEAMAYRSVNSTLRSFKKLLDTIKGSVDTCGTALERWQRAENDFRSAAELRLNYDNAQTNAVIMDQHVAELTGERWKLQEIQEAVETQRVELQKRFDALKKKLPPEATKNERGDENDSKSPSENPKPEEQPNKGDQGKEMVLTPEEAMRLLSSLKLDLSRQYSAQNMPDDQKKNAGRNW